MPTLGNSAIDAFMMGITCCKGLICPTCFVRLRYSKILDAWGCPSCREIWPDDNENPIMKNMESLRG